MTKSPHYFTVPNSGHWYVTVDLAGLRGSTRSSVRMMPKPLSPLRSSSRSPMPQAPRVSQSPVVDFAVDNDTRKSFDVFISHASEDKEKVAAPLAAALVELNVQVWYDEFELRIGDSLRQKIDAGLTTSKAGIVILSHDFFRKGWPKYELDGLVTNNVAGQQMLLPIWHGLSHDEVREYSASLADKVALGTDKYSVEEIAAEIAGVVRAA